MELTLETEEFTVVGSSYTSQVQNLNRAWYFSYHLIYSNGSGTATLQYSNDPSVESAWINIQSFPLVGSSSAMWNPPDRGAAYARIIFENSNNTVVKLIFNNKREL